MISFSFSAFWKQVCISLKTSSLFTPWEGGMKNLQYHDLLFFLGVFFFGLCLCCSSFCRVWKRTLCAACRHMLWSEEGMRWELFIRCFSPPSHLLLLQSMVLEPGHPQSSGLSSVTLQASQQNLLFWDEALCWHLCSEPAVEVLSRWGSLPKATVLICLWTNNKSGWIWAWFELAWLCCSITMASYFHLCLWYNRHYIYCSRAAWELIEHCGSLIVFTVKMGNQC